MPYRPFSAYQNDATAEARARDMVGDNGNPDVFFLTIGMSYYVQADDHSLDWDGEPGASKTVGEYPNMHAAKRAMTDISLHMVDGPRNASIEDRHHGQIYARTLTRYKSGRVAEHVVDDWQRFQTWKKEREADEHRDLTALAKDLGQKLESRPASAFHENVDGVYKAMQADGMNDTEAEDLSDDDLWQHVLIYMHNMPTFQHTSREDAEDLANGVVARYRLNKSVDLDDVARDLNALVQDN